MSVWCQFCCFFYFLNKEIKSVSKLTPKWHTTGVSLVSLSQKWHVSLVSVYTKVTPNWQCECPKFWYFLKEIIKKFVNSKQNGGWCKCIFVKCARACVQICWEWKWIWKDYQIIENTKTTHSHCFLHEPQAWNHKGSWDASSNVSIKLQNQ